MGERERKRTFAQVCANYLMWPGGSGFEEPDESESARHQAIAEVLCCMPEEDYGKLRELCEQEAYQWFIPPAHVLARVDPFGANVYPPQEPGRKSQLGPYARVIYLSPALEKRAFSIVLASVAHELAHLVLGHKIMEIQPDQYLEQEEQAWNLVAAWGFEEEAKKHESVSKWHESYERSQVRKWLAEREKQQ